MDNILVRRFLASLSCVACILAGCGNPCDAPLLSPYRLIAPYVGQGAGVLVVQNGRAIAFDAGPDSSSALSRTLRAQGIARVEVLVVSHWDLDHVGGLDTLLAAGQIDGIVYGAEPVDAWMQAKKSSWCSAIPNGCRAIPPKNSLSTLDGAKLAFLRENRAALTENDRSSVTLLSDASGAGLVLAPGDLDTSGEASLLARFPAIRAKTILVGHHGSRSSSSLPFLGAVGASVAIVQAGYPNTYGHPHREAMERIESVIRDVRRPTPGRTEFISL